MRKLLAILAAVMLVTLMGIASAQAWTLGTSDLFTLTYDGGTNISMASTNFNFSLDPDPHMWDPGWTGDKSTYNSHHKFQSAVNAFFLTINSAGNVDAYDRNNGVSSLTSSNNYWAITLDSLANSPIRGLSATNLQQNGGTITGTLVSDGIFHWYGNYPDTNMTTAEGYNPNFNFVFTGTNNGNGTYTGTMTLYATAVPLPGAVWLLGSGLAGLAFYRKRRATTQR